MAKEKKLDEFALFETLKTFECPSNWKFPQTTFEKMDGMQIRIHHLEMKIKLVEEKNEKFNEFQWRKYVFCVALSYVYSKVDKQELAFEALDRAVALTQAPGIEDYPFIKSYRPAFLHIATAMRGMFYFDQGDYAKAQEMVDQLDAQPCTGDVERAALLGIKASVYNEFGGDCVLHVLDDVREAVRLNPDESEWSFILGKVLRRIRKLAAFFEVPEKEEIAALQNAYAKNKCFAYCLFLAISYKELSTKLFQKFGMDTFGDKIRGLNEQSLQLFRETLEYDDLTSTALAKVSRGLAELPYPFKDVEKAKELALMAVEMDPDNAMVLHTLAMHYERYDLDFEKALEYNAKALKSGSYGSGMDIIKIGLRLNPGYDPMPILEGLKEVYSEPGHLNETLIQEACYYLIMQGDMDRALQIFLKLMDQNPDLHQLNVCKPMWLQIRSPISIYELLYHELMSSRNKNKYMETLVKIKRIHPELFEKEVDEKFLDNLKAVSEEILRKIAKKRPTNNLRYSGQSRTDQRDNRNRNSDNWRDNRQNNQGSSFGPSRYNNSRSFDNSRNFENTSRNYNNTRNYNNSARNYNNSARNYDNAASNHDNTSRNSDNTASNFDYLKNFDNPRGFNQNRNNQNIGNRRSFSSQNESGRSENWRRKNASDEDARNQSFEDNATGGDLNKSNNRGENKPKSPAARREDKGPFKGNTPKEIPAGKDSKSQVAKTENVDGQRKTRREKSFVEKNAKLTTAPNEKKTDKGEKNTGKIEKKTDKVEKKTDTGGKNTDEIQFEHPKPVNKVSNTNDQNDYVYNENKFNADEEAYRKKMNAKLLDRQNFVKRMKQLSNQVKEESGTESNRSVPAEENISVETGATISVCDSETIVEKSNTSKQDAIPTDTPQDIVDQISKLAIEDESKPVEKTREKKKTAKASSEANDDTASNALADQLKQLNKDQLEVLLKVLQKSEKKKKKKATELKEEVDDETAESSALPPPKIAVVTAGNQAIRQPTGPSEQNFGRRKKTLSTSSDHE